MGRQSHAFNVSPIVASLLDPKVMRGSSFFTPEPTITRRFGFGERAITCDLLLDLEPESEVGEGGDIEFEGAKGKKDQ